MSNENRPFIYVDVTTRVKVYTDNSEFAKDMAVDAVQNMGADEYLASTTMKTSSIRTDSADTKEFKLINKEYDVWGYALDSRTFVFDNGRSDLSEEDLLLDDEQMTIDLDDDKYDFDEVMQSPVVFVGAGQEGHCIEIESGMSEMEIATQIYIGLKGL